MYGCLKTTISIFDDVHWGPWRGEKMVWKLDVYYKISHVI